MDFDDYKKIGISNGIGNMVEHLTYLKSQFFSIGDGVMDMNKHVVNVLMYALNASLPS